MVHAEWLPIVMQESFNEIYVMDPHSLRFTAVNKVACRNLQYEETDLIGKTPFDISPGLSRDSFMRLANSLASGDMEQAFLTVTHLRADGSVYPVELKLLHYASEETPAMIAICNDVSARDETAKALSSSELRFRAITSNTPGLVYQFLRRPDGTTSFPYVSEGCHALLGITAEQLCEDSGLLLRQILPDDRDAYLASMVASASEMKIWNWEGRIWIEEWNDVKWINLRSTPSTLADGSVQWDGIMTNITQSRMEQAEIRQSRTQLAELSAHIETLKEQERTRIAREIHDDLGGNLTAIKMALALLAKRFPADEPEWAEKAAYVDSLVDRTIESVHRIAGDLRPSILDLGIVAAIDWQAKEFEKQLGIPCDFSSNKKDIELHADQATALFRIFQEAVTNVGKHAQASKVNVRLMAANRSLKLEIIDNGRGIEATDRLKPKSFGIRGMKERISALGGELAIHRAVTGGTVVAIRIPFGRS